MIHTLTAFGVRIAHWSTQTCNATQNDGQVESSVDDFVVERGTVSTRVALVLRSVEVYPPVPRFVWHWPNCNLSLPSDRPKARSTRTEPNSLGCKTHGMGVTNQRTLNHTALEAQPPNRLPNWLASSDGHTMGSDLTRSATHMHKLD